MEFEKLSALNGQETLKVNNIFLYSKYRPYEEAEKFIQKEINTDATGYLLIGLGLGYHLKALSSLVDENKQISVLCLDMEELLLYKTSAISEELHNKTNIKIVSKVADLEINVEDQIIIPHVWLQSMETNHPLYPFLLDIKTKQMSYERFSLLMEENFKKNKLLNDYKLMEYRRKVGKIKVACLISSGPSLEKTREWLKGIKKDNIYLLSVGSALKPLLKYDVIPDAVIISDSQPEIITQLKDCDFKGDLFYLSTANHEAVVSYNYNRCILLQNGYKLSENLAQKVQYPTFDTGGSVATVAFSLLKYFNIENIVFFGQDLGFLENKTHVTDSTSGRVVNENEKLHKVRSNCNEWIKTTPNLMSYLRWFEATIKKTTINVYNTAVHGAKIERVPLINKEEFIALIK